jgi:hypothetical protein
VAIRELGQGGQGSQGSLCGRNVIARKAVHAATNSDPTPLSACCPRKISKTFKVASEAGQGSHMAGYFIQFY